MDALTTTQRDEKGLEIIAKLKAGIEFEMEHQYINAIGRSGDFTSFIRKQARDALKIYKNSSKWEMIYTIMERYPYLDIATRMNIVKKILNSLSELKDFYIQEEIDKEGIKDAQSKKASTEIVPADPSIDISTMDVKFVKGVGPRLGEKFKTLGIETTEDLLNYLPRDHISYSEVTPIKELEVDDDASILGFIHKVTAFKSPRKNLVILTIIIRDNSGQLKINKYFKGNSTHFYLKQYKGQYPEGSHVLAVGKVQIDKFSKQKTLNNAVIEVISEDFTESERNNQIHTAKIVPIYPLTEGLSLMILRKLIYFSLKTYKDNLKEFIPEGIREKNNLISYQDALEQIHFPTEFEMKNKAAMRLLFNDFFLMQLSFMQIRKKHKNKHKGIRFNCFENGLVDKFINSLPFELTGAQQRAFYNEILPDMVSSTPMHRLLQGDVGSGKTIVAFLSLLVAVADGYQGAIMVPTEILAEQHYKKFCDYVDKMEANLEVRVGLLVGKQRVKEKREVLSKLKNGTINIVVGTHALIQESVEFSKLGLVVIDEQHRFGVKQREKLAQKAVVNEYNSQLQLNDRINEYDREIDQNMIKDTENKSNDVTVEKLFMTATPIPRTLALAMHGDLDMTEVDEMPAGRKPIITEVVKRKTDAHKLIKQELDKGHQAYIVFPLIDESEALSAKAATTEFEKLRKTTFKDYSVGLIHGKMKDSEKEAVMQAFRHEDINILVSTTVIEVGVDVPKATVIVIESAERFGLAQLHQLRGRVGRNDLQSYCLLSSSSNTETAMTRLGIMTKTNNGFILAQEDLKIRGAGDIAGLRQSGIPESTLQGLIDQEDILVAARESARSLIEISPDLEDYPILKKRLDQARFTPNLNAG